MIDSPVRKKLREARDLFYASLPSKDAQAVFDELYNKLAEVPREYTEVGAHEVVKVGKKRVFIGMPHLHDVNAYAVSGAIGAAAPTDVLHTYFTHQASSLLCNCFNTLWGNCISDYECDYWLLHHADISSNGGYALTLIEELENNGYDVMHAVSPIKDNFGMMSTAVGTMDPWNIPRRLTRFEMKKLPQTFGSEEIIDAIGQGELHSFDPGPWFLMPNTGLFLVRLTNDDGTRRDWIYKFPGFTILDRLVRMEFDIDLETGRKVLGTEHLVPLEEPMHQGENHGFAIVPQVLSEDWNFGRWAYANGLKVGGTNKVTVFHHGAYIFCNNQGPSQWLQDEHWVGRYKTKMRRQMVAENGGTVGPYVSKVTEQVPIYPEDVAGWLSLEEGSALYRWAKGKRVLEIGAYCGRSTICMAQSAQFVHSVDPFDGRGTPDPRSTLDEYNSNIDKYGFSNKVQSHVGTSKEIISVWEADEKRDASSQFGLVFVDGAHDCASVTTDVEMAFKVIEVGGLIAFHDYGRERDPEVKLAVDQFMIKGLLEVVEEIDDWDTDSHILLTKLIKKA